MKYKDSQNGRTEGKFVKQVAYIDKMSANITINSNNFEIMKNTVNTLENKSKADKEHLNEVITQKA